MKRIELKLEKFDYSKLTSEQGHEYGKRRVQRAFKHKNERRAKDKLRKELKSW